MFKGLQSIVHFLALGILIGANGCASIFSVSHDEIQLDSEPEGAMVSFNGNVLVITPFLVTQQIHSVQAFLVLEKDGYPAKRVELERAVTVAALFNLGWSITGLGATSWGIDYMTGKMFMYSPRSYVEELAQKAAYISPLAYSV